MAAVVWHRGTLEERVDKAERFVHEIRYELSQAFYPTSVQTLR